MPEERFFLNDDPLYYMEVSETPVGNMAQFPPGTQLTIGAVADVTVDPMGNYVGWWWEHAADGGEKLWVPGASPGTFGFSMPDILPGGDHTEVLLCACTSVPEDDYPIGTVCTVLDFLPYSHLMYCSAILRPGCCIEGGEGACFAGNRLVGMPCIVSTR